ncbi:hypothetical protein TrLO_g531 [Triparma laevis f. longispina]|uniref:Uncharacterized protein n=1 Tax=Triparma laevis f. longispina TaxID=1714387 RepID=A0A9W7FIR4_9STRA|nr:hypothetical protein TrLO_g531 [Triparma laevis f. longispina]
MSSLLEQREIEFTNAFNANRATLAGFANCASLEELHVVRDGFYLGLATELCPIEAVPVKQKILQGMVAAQSGGFKQTIESARLATGWDAMLEALFLKAMFVGTDLQSMWIGLEKGRIEWLTAVSAAHHIKVVLKSSVENEGGSEGDTSDAMMVWIYAMCVNVPKLEKECEEWASVVGMKEKMAPLNGYDAEKWDPRKKEWAPLDLGAQAVAERGGSDLKKAWAA